MFFAHTSRQGGVALLELAIVVPAVILLIAGGVNYGFAFREMQLVSDAVKTGARIAAAAAVDTESFNLQDCSDLRTTADNTVNGILDQAGLDPAQWTVETTFCESRWENVLIIREDDLEQVRLRFVVVTIDRTESGCIFCTESYFIEGTMPHARATYALEGSRNTCEGETFRRCPR